MNIQSALDKLTIDSNGIYSYQFSNKLQEDEIKMRKGVANESYTDYLYEISCHHSVPVMDNEIENFLQYIPSNGVIIDVGGCWGWHWRNLKKLRPDVKVVIVDLIKENLFHAKNLLKDNLNQNIFLVHGDATSLKFPSEFFDGYWTVQTLQHIPNFEDIIKEAHRVLKPSGVFANYSLCNSKLVQYIFQLFGKKYHISGAVAGNFYLSRANKEQKEIIEHIFNSSVKERFTEILFKPEFKITLPGKLNSFLGKIDIFLSNFGPILKLFARQHSFHINKKSN